MNLKLIILSLLFLSQMVFAQAQDFDSATVAKMKPIAVADQYYYSGQEGNLAAEIIFKCKTFDTLAHYVNLRFPVGTFGDKTWQLGEVLVRADFDGNGHNASIIVSGPQPLIHNYVKKLAEKKRETFYDFSAKYLNYKPTAYWER